MPKAKPTYTREVTILVSFSDAHQASLFDSVFFEVMPGKGRLKSDRYFMDFVFDHELYFKVWPKLLPEQKKEFTDLCVDAFIRINKIPELIEAVTSYDDVSLYPLLVPAARSWITANCMGILQTLVDEKKNRDALAGDEELKGNADKVSVLIHRLSRLGYQVSPPTKVRQKKSGLKGSP